VLFVDVMRPLPFPESLVNRLIVQASGLSPFVLDAKRNQEAWERRFLARKGSAARQTADVACG
jgi:ornithine lipid ester-linked acyl 2-hydroxylase